MRFACLLASNLPQLECKEGLDAPENSIESRVGLVCLTNKLVAPHSCRLTGRAKRGCEMSIMAQCGVWHHPLRHQGAPALSSPTPSRFPTRHQSIAFENTTIPL